MDNKTLGSIPFLLLSLLNMSVMKPLFFYSLFVLLILLSQSLPISAHQAGALDPNLHHHYHETQMSPKTKDFLTSFEAQKLEVYVRKRSGGGSGALATRSRGKTSSAVRKGLPFLHVFLCLNLFLGLVWS